MFEIHTQFIIAATAIEALKGFVSSQKIHPILVNFTAALVPVSVGADIVSRILKNESIRATAWWTLFIAAFITPFTAIAGWLFWMKDDVGVEGMAIHKWLGTSLAVLLIGLVLWRWSAYKNARWPSKNYLFVGVLVVTALVYQGHLGGEQSFGAMDSSTSETSHDSASEHNSSATQMPLTMPGMKMPATNP